MKVKTIVRVSVLAVIATLLVNEEREPINEEDSPQSFFTKPPENFTYLENRSFEDRPDDTPGERQIHVIYVIPSDGEDKGYDTSGIIAASMESGERWLENQTDGRRLRMDTWNGMLDVSFYRLSHTEAESPGFMYEELRSSGFNATNKHYAVYYGGWWPVCGNTISGVETAMELAVVYLGKCDFYGLLQLEDFSRPTSTMFHEIFHVLGAVQNCAPHKTGGGHVSDSPHDIMYESEEGFGGLPPFVLDYGRDDYYGHGRDDCLDIAKSPFWQDSTV